MSRSHQVAAFQVEVVASPLHPHLDDVLGLLFGLDEFCALLRGLAQRLLHVDVFDGGQSVQNHLRLPMFRRGDEHSLDILIREKLFVIPVSGRLAPLSSCGRRQASFEVRLVNIADGPGEQRGVLLENCHHERASRSGADHFQHNLVRGRSTDNRHASAGYQEHSAIHVISPLMIRYSVSSRVSASPRRSSFVPMRSMIERNRLQSLRLSSPASR